LVKKMSIFTKIIILIGVLLFPILLLYGRSYYISVNVVEQTLKVANREQLSFFLNQVDATVQRLSASTIFLSKDLDINQYQSNYLKSILSKIDVIPFKEKITQKLDTQKLFANWDNELSVYYPRLREVLSTNPVMKYDEAYLLANARSGWQIERVIVNGHNEYAFAYYEVNPYNTSSNITEAQYIIKVRIYERNIRNVLNQFKADSIRDPFLFSPEYGVIGNSSMNAAIAEELAVRIRSMELNTSGIVEQTVDGKKYLVTYIQSKQLGWYVVDYIAVQNILSPIMESRNYFYFCVTILIFLSVLSVFLLYRHVQVPIQELIHGVRRIEKGHYSSRMRSTTASEFAFLFNSFNQMAAQIENLIESVISEQLRSREAVLKQLQAQINPHFLFNCLAFIMSMAKTRNYEAILSMAHSLSKYYRYTTRSDISFCKLREEVDFVRHYLDIQQMRMTRICYHINIQDSMLDLCIPRLLLQPLIENAIIHGIELKSTAGLIYVTGEKTGDDYSIIVDDDGNGMDEERILLLTKRINGPLLEEMSCGVWNVNQRLKLKFGGDSCLKFMCSPYGGTRVIIKIITQLSVRPSIGCEV
jgi:two-component system sensor histidine kinase YesM